MKLPYTYKGFEVHVTTSRTLGNPILEIRKPDSRETSCGYFVIKRYTPPMKIIYLGYAEPPYAYDHDIKHCEELIDKYINLKQKQ